MHTNRHGQLTAAGNPVHRFRPRPADDKPKIDEVAIIDRYQDAAAAIHRTFVVPRGDCFLVGCSCGWIEKTSAGTMAGRVAIRAQQHVLEKADELYERMEQPL